MAVFYITRSDLGPGRRDRLLSAMKGHSVSLASGLRQTDCILFSLALARVTFARMSEAFAVQMNGFG